MMRFLHRFPDSLEIIHFVHLILIQFISHKVHDFIFKLLHFRWICTIFVIITPLINLWLPLRTIWRLGRSLLVFFGDRLLPLHFILRILSQKLHLVVVFRIRRQLNLQMTVRRSIFLFVGVGQFFIIHLPKTIEFVSV